MNFVRRVTPPLLYDAATKFRNRLRGQATPSEELLFDGDSQMFRRIIADATSYGEYGVGASTNYVYTHTNANIIAVDTSKAWVERILSGKDLSRISISHVDVGPVGDWGRPIDYSRRTHFSEYTEGIWKAGTPLDVVLIDGRFRVACFLTTLLYGKPGTQVIFDDYVNRPFYHVVEELVPRLEICGRQARFELPAKFDEVEVNNLLDRFAYVLD